MHLYLDKYALIIIIVKNIIRDCFMKKIIFVLIISLSIFSISCEKDKSTIDKATDAINEKIDDASKKLQSGIKKTGNAAEKTLDNASETIKKVDAEKILDDTSKSIESGLKKAKENISNALK